MLYSEMKKPTWKSAAKRRMEAFEKTQQLTPDLVILDLNMPGGGGFSAANRFRNAGLTPKILIYTTHTLRGLERMARAADRDGLVQHRI